MALITTYATLQTAMDNWLDHTLHSAKYPEMIQLFEAAANRKLRVREQEVQTSLSPDGTTGAVVLPSDYLSWRHVTWRGSTDVELEYVSSSYLRAAYPNAESGTPRIFAIEGSGLYVRPISTTTLRFDYFQKIAALSESATTNWLLTAHPDLYLFGSLAEAEMFGVNDERAAGWLARRDAIFDEIEKLSNKTRGAGAIRVMGATP